MWEPEISDSHNAKESRLWNGTAWVLISAPILTMWSQATTFFTFLLSVSMRIFFFKIPHISDTKQYFYLSLWLISLSMMPSSFIYAVTNGSMSFFSWPNNISLCILHTPQFLYPFIHRWTLTLFLYLGYR